MTEEIKYNKDEKWIPYKQLAETPQQMIARLEQENKELKEVKDKYYQQTLDDEILMNELSLEVDLRKKESDFYLEKLSKYRSALDRVQRMILCAWEKGKYLDGGLYDDLTNEFAKINEVLK